jgi:hypothetical protein
MSRIVDFRPRVPRAPLAVRGRRAQYVGNTGPESPVPRAVSGGGGAGLRPVGADAGEGRA